MGSPDTAADRRPTPLTRTRRHGLPRPPGPRGERLASLRMFRSDPIGLLRRMRRHGDHAFFRIGPFDAHLLSHPDLVKEVLVTRHRSFMKGQGLQEAKRVLGAGLLTSEGEFHRRQRRLANPAFHHERVNAYGEAMVQAAGRAAAGWRDGAEADVHREMSELTLDIVGRTLFGTGVHGEDAARVREALAAALAMFDRLTVPLAGLMERLPLPSTRRFERARETLDGIVYRLIAERRAEGVDRGDFLSMLLLAQDEEGGGGMSDLQVRDEAMTIFLAGHETTANALTWTWYLLSQHPEVETRLHEEIDQVLGERPPSPSDLPDLSYAHMVLSESMRLYPPAWILGRRAVEDVEIGGYVLPAGATALMSQYLIQHDERWWPDPYRFDPGRWAAPSPGRPRFAYFPFGAGPRVCIGESFAWMEGVLVLVTLARHWRMRLVPGQPFGLSPRVTLRPRHPVRMTLHARG